MTGCMNPAAANYNPAATVPDLTCLYLKNVDGECYLFREVQDAERNDFTASFSFPVQDWVFFHDYIPDDYIQAREQLYTVKDNRIFKHNAGPMGRYYDSTPKPFFIDIVVTDQKESILSAVQWITEVLNDRDKDLEHKTFTHITVWNNYQCTGRIPLTSIFRNLQYETNRKSKGTWSFNDFRDIVIDNDEPFLQDLFHDFAVDASKVDVNLPWYKKALLVDDHFIVRFEFDNTENLNILLQHQGALFDNSF